VNVHKKPEAAETVEDVLRKMDEQRSTNLRIWNELGTTDPAHTKSFKRGGGFTGTALKPMWVNKRLTERFGPCGTGWGFDKPEFQLVNGDNKELLVFCTITAWYVEDGDRHDVHGVGGDKVITHIKANQQYNRPERWENDDEAFKKAFTDALGNAFKFVGVGADVHMGLFDDSKYVAEVREQFQPKPDNPATGETPPAKRVPLDGPYTSATQLKTAAKEFVRTLESMGDLGELLAWQATSDFNEFCTQLERDMPDWWRGGPSVPAEFVPLEIRIDQKKRDLEQLESIGAK